MLRSRQTVTSGVREKFEVTATEYFSPKHKRSISIYVDKENTKHRQILINYYFSGQTFVVTSKENFTYDALFNTRSYECDFDRTNYNFRLAYPWRSKRTFQEQNSNNSGHFFVYGLTGLWLNAIGANVSTNVDESDSNTNTTVFVFENKASLSSSKKSKFKARLEFDLSNSRLLNVDAIKFDKQVIGNEDVTVVANVEEFSRLNKLEKGLESFISAQTCVCMEGEGSEAVSNTASFPNLLKLMDESEGRNFFLFYIQTRYDGDSKVVIIISEKFMYNKEIHCIHVSWLERGNSSYRTIYKMFRYKVGKKSHQPAKASNTAEPIEKLINTTLVYDAFDGQCQIGDSIDIEQTLFSKQLRFRRFVQSNKTSEDGKAQFEIGETLYHYDEMFGFGALLIRLAEAQIKRTYKLNEFIYYKSSLVNVRIVSVSLSHKDYSHKFYLYFRLPEIYSEYSSKVEHDLNNLLFVLVLKKGEKVSSSGYQLVEQFKLKPNDVKNYNLLYKFEVNGIQCGVEDFWSDLEMPKICEFKEADFEHLEESDNPNKRPNDDKEDSDSDSDSDLDDGYDKPQFPSLDDVLRVGVNYTLQMTVNSIPKQVAQVVEYFYDNNDSLDAIYYLHIGDGTIFKTLAASCELVDDLEAHWRLLGGSSVQLSSVSVEDTPRIMRHYGLGALWRLAEEANAKGELQFMGIYHKLTDTSKRELIWSLEKPTISRIKNISSSLPALSIDFVFGAPEDTVGNTQRLLQQVQLTKIRIKINNIFNNSSYSMTKFERVDIDVETIVVGAARRVDLRLPEECPENEAKKYEPKQEDFPTFGATFNCSDAADGKVAANYRVDYWIHRTTGIQLAPIIRARELHSTRTKLSHLQLNSSFCSMQLMSISSGPNYLYLEHGEKMCRQVYDVSDFFVFEPFKQFGFELSDPSPMLLLARLWLKFEALIKQPPVNLELHNHVHYDKYNVHKMYTWTLKTQNEADDKGKQPFEASMTFHRPDRDPLVPIEPYEFRLSTRNMDTKEIEELSLESIEPKAFVEIVEKTEEALAECAEMLPPEKRAPKISEMLGSIGALHVKSEMIVFDDDKQAADQSSGFKLLAFEEWLRLGTGLRVRAAPVNAGNKQPTSDILLLNTSQEAFELNGVPLNCKLLNKYEDQQQQQKNNAWLSSAIGTQLGLRSRGPLSIWWLLEENTNATFIDRTQFLIWAR